MKEETAGRLGEKEMLRRLSRFVGENDGVVRAFSEDCAVLESDGDRYRLITMDVQVDGVHFRREWASAREIGRKAVNVNVSDISAMGGRARRFLVSLGLPPETPARFVDELYEGMQSASRQSNLVLAGGNLSSSPVLFLDIAMEGDVSKERILLRNGARSGDSICVTGFLGAAAAGLRYLESGCRPDGVQFLTPEGRPVSSQVLDAIRTHLDPPVLQDLAGWLADTGCVSSMMDLSDGLASDLPEICRESKLGALINISNIPVASCIRDEADSRDLALFGGEDYHLLFTIRSEKRLEFFDRAAQRGIAIHEVGAMVQQDRGILLKMDDGRTQPLKPGFSHFAGEL